MSAKLTIDAVVLLQKRSGCLRTKKGRLQVGVERLRSTGLPWSWRTPYGRKLAALLTRMSRRPKCSAAFAKSVRISDTRLRSAGKAMARRPSFSISATSVARFGSDER